MPATMDDVNEMRELAAGMCGDINRQATKWRDLECKGVLDFGWDMFDAAQHAQLAYHTEAWVTLRTRIEALRTTAEDTGGIYALGGEDALREALDIMDELEGPR